MNLKPFYVLSEYHCQNIVCNRENCTNFHSLDCILGVCGEQINYLENIGGLENSLERSYK